MVRKRSRRIESLAIEAARLCRVGSVVVQLSYYLMVKILVLSPVRIQLGIDLTILLPENQLKHDGMRHESHSRRLRARTSRDRTLTAGAMRGKSW